MKQFKAEWQYNRTPDTESYNEHETINHLITQHNALCNYLEEQQKVHDGGNMGMSSNFGPVTRVPSLPHQPVITAPQTITLPKPEFWDSEITLGEKSAYKAALQSASKASGILFKLED